MRTCMLAFSLLLLVQCVLRGDTVPAVFTGTPDDSWSYFQETNTNHRYSTTYFPTSATDFSNAAFQGWVTYNGGSPTPSWWEGQGENSFQIFSTIITSSTDITIPIKVGSDDGHSLFINNNFVGGGGFGIDYYGNITLQANVPVLVTIAGYNGIGSWEFCLIDSITNGPLDDLPGISLEGVTLYEPSTNILVVSGLLLMTVIHFVSKGI